MLQNKISLYPGFVTKAKNIIVWHSVEPTYDVASGQWRSNPNLTVVTNCIHDPWPFTAGGSDCVWEVIL